MFQPIFKLHQGDTMFPLHGKRRWVGDGEKREHHKAMVHIEECVFPNRRSMTTEFLFVILCREVKRVV